MDCKRIRGQLTHYILGELPAWEALAVEEHLEQCPECQQEWQLFQRTTQILDAWEEVTPPPDLTARLLARLARERPQKRPAWAAYFKGRTALGRSVWAAIWGGMAAGASFLIVEQNVSHPHLSPPILLLCFLLWAVVYPGLFRLAFAEPAAASGRARAGTLWRCLQRAAPAALLAAGMMAIVSFAFPLLGAATLQDLTGLVRASVGGVPDSVVYVAFGALSALVSLLPASVLAARLLPGLSPARSLVAVCLFMVAVAPELLIVCVPLTLGVYASLLAGSAAGALAGDALGSWMIAKLAHGS
jgi:hypothetical protein